MKESIFVTLQKCTVFEGFTPEEIREALSMVSYRMVELAARETYVLAGMPCRYADIIVEGEMIARMSGLSGKQAQIERLGESMLIAPAYIFAHNNEMPVSVETSKKTTLLRMRFRIWLSEIRFNAAKKMMLDYPDYSNDIISAECGFSARTYLYRVFKTKEGCTPAEWREEQAATRTIS